MRLVGLVRTGSSSHMRIVLFVLPQLFFAGIAHVSAAPLRVVTDNNYPPYAFQDTEGKPQGYVVDLWRLWESKTGVEVDLQPMQWSAAQRAVLDGRADVIDMIFRTPVREQLYDYSPPYAKLPVGIYVDTSINGIHDVSSLQGFAVAVQRGDACVDKLAGLGIDNLIPYPDYEAIMVAAQSDEIKVFCMDEYPAGYYLYLFRDQLAFVKAFTLYEGQFHWAVNSGDREAFALVSHGMSLITPAEREALNEKWLKQPIQFQPYIRLVLSVVPGALVVVALALLWIRILSRQVSARTAELRHKNEQLERTSHELVIEKAQLRSIVDNSPDVMVLKDGGGVYIDCNAGFLEMAGVSREKVIGYTDDDIFVDRHLIALIKESDEDVLSADQPSKYETTVVSRAGGKTEWEVIKVPIHAEAGGKPTRLLGVARDITQRRRADEERRIAAVAFESQDGMIITDARGVIERSNAAFSRISGYPQSETVGRTPKILGFRHQDRNIEKEMWACLKRDGYWAGEVTCNHRNGNGFEARLSVTAVSDEEGRTVHYVGNLQDISEEKRARELAEHLKRFDHLTDLPNRTLLEERMVLAVENRAKVKSYGAVVMLGLDSFQRINNTRGHAFGDLVLLEAAKRIRPAAHGSDNLYRFSGDCFVLLVENLGPDRHRAIRRVQFISDAIRLSLVEPMVIDTQRVVCTASIGIALFFDRQVSPAALLCQAELALFKSKSGGRDQVNLFEDAMQSEIERRSWMESELREVITRNQLELYYQIQVDTQGRPIGAEALIRWIHPDRGVIPPMEFISLAEETGLIVPVGEWVITSACKQLALWERQEGLRHLTLAVNVSPRQFKSGYFVETIEAAVRHADISTCKLKLEVTESLAIDDFDASIAKLERLKAGGFKVSLDDFGTGNSSLNYLTKLPLTQLKIDKSFVDHLPSSHRDAMVAQTIIAMGHGLGLDVIAEGVETKAQYRFLVEHGCHAFQGYLFGKPMPLAEFEAAVREVLPVTESRNEA